LLNGAAGGVGTFAVQLAKSFGADVTGVCSTRNVDVVRSIGADRVIDYTRDDFTQGPQRYDLILDTVGNHSFSACRRVMQPGGTYVVVGGPDGRWLGPLAHVLKALVVSRVVSQNLSMFVASVNTGDLTVLKGLIEAKKVTPVIDRCYPLREIPEALRYLEEGHARGKVAITFSAI
jgi:NADPH:quinone reductase-like Zn-dependent oxidoreductase